MGHSLTDQNITIGQKQNALPGLGFPQTPDDLKGGEGFTGAGCHDQQNALLALRNRLGGAVDGKQLVVTRGFIAAVAVIILRDQRMLLPVDMNALMRQPLLHTH